ncbi:MAG: cytidine deaminase [Balneolales bacterium]|nr:cytidine deaminase [Balneolales bacterium]
MTLSTLEKNSYVPYSGKKQACYVSDIEGTLYPGVRIENASFPLTISRIQAALFSCLSAGKKPKKLYFPDEPLLEEHLQYWINEYKLETEFNVEDCDGQLFEVPKLPTGLSNDEIYEILSDLCSFAVTPNSSFEVSALLEVSDGYIPGVNVECSAWELGLCAERMAISRAISAGYTQFGKLYVMAPKSDYVSPCGACRQVIFEHMRSSRIVLFQNAHTEMSVTSTQLLPFHFSGTELGKF